MKFKTAIPVIVSLLMFGSCYEFDSLPAKYKINSEYALPIFDTSLLVADFDFFKNNFVTSNDISAGTEVYTGEHRFGLYFKDFYDNDNTIEWFEPKLIIDDDIPAGASIRLNIFTINASGGRFYFWLPPGSSIPTPGPTVIPDMPVRIDKDVIDQMKDANDVYFGFSLVFNNTMSFDQVKDYVVRSRLGIKVSVKTSIKR